MKLEINNLKFAYGPNARTLYEDFSLTVENNERVGIMAPSGFGKTTLCKLIAGYEKPLAGTILLDGKPLTDYEKANGGYSPVQMIWQHPETVINPRFKMKQVLAEGDNVELRIIEALGIKQEWMERYPQELSGGELQRFCIARALGERTQFILADEISTMLDLITQKEIWTFLIEETKRRNIGLITVSHSEALLSRICTRVVDLTIK